MAAKTAERRCVNGPLHGWPVYHSHVRGSQAWIDSTGRCYTSSAPGRALYRIEDRGVMRFVGHGARQCGGCGVTIDPNPLTGGRMPVCPLCGAPE